MNVGGILPSDGGTCQQRSVRDLFRGAVHYTIA